MMLLIYCQRKLYFNKKMFFLQIEKHWTTNEVQEMTLEKLQMVATCNTSPLQKIKLSELFRDARRFPPKPVSKDKLLSFLNKCV